MLREFTQDVGRNYKKGDVRDLPQSTWMRIAAQAVLPGEKGPFKPLVTGDGKSHLVKRLDKFSKPVENATLRSSTRGPALRRDNRSGATIQ